VSERGKGADKRMHDRISWAGRTVPSVGQRRHAAHARQQLNQPIPVFCRKSREFLRRGRKENRAGPASRCAKSDLHVEIGPLRSYSRATVELGLSPAHGQRPSPRVGSPLFLIERAAFRIGAEAIVEVYGSAADRNSGGRELARVLIDDHEFLSPLKLTRTGSRSLPLPASVRSSV